MRLGELAERGRALVFDVLEYGRPVRAFALRIDGRAVAYLNRCAHVPVEMDWNPGEFLDAERVSSSAPSTARPTIRPPVAVLVDPARAGAWAVHVTERDGKVSWYPSRDIRPAFVEEPIPSLPSEGLHHELARRTPPRGTHARPDRRDTCNGWVRRACGRRPTSVDSRVIEDFARLPEGPQERAPVAAVPSPGLAARVRRVAWGLFGQHHGTSAPSSPHTALIEVRGEISSEARPMPKP